MLCSRKYLLLSVKKGRRSLFACLQHSNSHFRTLEQYLFDILNLAAILGNKLVCQLGQTGGFSGQIKTKPNWPAEICIGRDVCLSRAFAEKFWAMTQKHQRPFSVYLVRCWDAGIVVVI